MLSQQINLFAYHLPLDSHEKLGNNAQLAKLHGWTVTGRFGPAKLGWLGEIAPMRLNELAASLDARLGRPPAILGDSNKLIKRIAWCSGAAQNLFEAAIAENVDVYISGEISEQTVHLAAETGVAYLCAGHHATERWGIKALGEHLQEQFKLKHTFIDIPSPV